MIRSLVSIFIVLGAVNAGARVDVKAIGAPKPLYELNRKNMYAIGRAETSNDLVTVLNGRIYVSHYDTKTRTAISSDSFKTRVAQMTYANVNSWTEAQLVGETRTPANLGPLMNKILKDTGYELAGRFPFLIKGKISEVSIAGVTEAEKISEKLIDGVIVGFLTKSFAASPTGLQVPEFKLEMHFVSDSGKTIGKVDDFRLVEKNKAALFLPR